MMFCAQCGQRLADGSKFCNACGTPVVAVTPSAAAAASSAANPATPPSAARAPEGAPRDEAPHSASTPPPAEPRPYPPPPPSGSSSAGAGFTAPNFDTAQASALARGIVARVKAILLTPNTEWPVIAAERSTASDIYLRYVAPLAAIGVIATLLGQTLIGTSVGPLGMVRVGILPGIAHAVLFFALTFLQVFLIAWLVDVLAPSFGGQRDPLAALKVTAYSFTPGWVAAILNIVPVLGLLGVLAALYGLYLLYLGLPVLMRCPKDKAIGYTVVLVICAIVLSVLVTMLSTCAVAGLGFAGMGALGRHTFNETVARSESSAATKEDATAAAATAAAAITAMGQAVGGGKDVQPVDFHELKAMLPASLPGMQRTEASGQGGEAMGIKGSSATARYSDGKTAQITIEIADLGSIAGLAAVAGKFNPSLEKETATGYERVRRVDGQLVHERYDRAARSGEMGVLVADRFSVSVEGSGIDAAALNTALKSIDLTSLASIVTAKR
jgi:hypothetical protein